MVEANGLMSDPVGPSASSGNALKLTWSFGFQKDLIGGVHSLSTASRRAVFYPAAHTGVIYDYARRQQTLLQGHCHLINCCVVSEDKRWIVTADKGPESMLVVWDAATGNPIKTIFRPHPLGVEAIDMSPDALFIVTLSAVDRGDEVGKSSTNSSKRKRFDQELSVWEWTSATNSNTALHSSYVATEDVQHSVRFNTYDVREVVTNGRQRVIFWSWASHKLLFYSPSLSQRDFRQAVGNFTQSLFVPDSTQALTGTEDGDLVLWDTVVSVPDDGAPAVASLAQVPDRKAVKIVRLGNSNSTDHKNGAALTVLTDMDGYLVLGSSDGAVRFFDFDFRLVAWFEDMNAGAVTSVSFACVDDEEDIDQKGEDDDNFSVPDFVVGTASAFIVGMSASLFGEHEPEKRRGTLLMQGINDAIHGLAAHPRLPQLALSSYSGVVQLWDYVGKRLIMMRRFDPERGFRPQCLTFSPDGRRLFIGFTSGAIKIVHAQRLDDMASFRLGKAAITDVRVSPDSALFVALDANLYMGMWRCKPGSSVAEDDLASPTGGDEWVYIGRCRAHSKPVTGLEFAWDGEGNLALVSVAEDRTMVEYALDRCSVLDGIVLKQAPTRIEQSGAPTACCWHPELRGLQEDLVVVANDEYKLKQWNASNKTCRKTTLGPCYGGPINKLVPVPLKRNAGFGVEGDEGSDVSERYCAYSTHEKVVGLLKLPLDGNPHKAMGLIAHPGAISNVDVTFDGNFLLTAGVEDLVVNMWEIHTSQLDILEASLVSENSTETATDREALALAPYLSLLEGGADGSFYHEIVDYFYLAQLRVQGEESMAVRDISGRIPLREIPNVMRAIGFYPTDQEIQHMCSEVKFSKFTQTSQAVESLDLNEFIKLYVNHRPVFGVGKAHIERAFEVLAKKAQQQRNASTTDLNGAPVLSWDLLEARLLHSGEAMTEDELHSCLKALVVSADGAKSGVAAMDREYSALKFADKVLGFDDYEEESETQEEVISGL